MKRLIAVAFLILLSACGSRRPGVASLDYKVFEPERGGVVRYQVWRKSEKRSEKSRLLAIEKAESFCGGKFKVVSEENTLTASSNQAYYVAPRAIVPLPRARHAYVNMSFVCEGAGVTPTNGGL